MAVIVMIHNKTESGLLITLHSSYYHYIQPMMYKPLLIALPFLCFVLGYASIRYIVGTDSFDTPTVIGSSIADACDSTTAHNLALKIMGYMHTAHLPPGIIVNQTPAPGSKIKAHQSLYVVVSKEPNTASAPDLVGMKESAIMASLYSRTFNITCYQVPSHKPRGECIAQIPKSGTIVSDNRIILYISDKQPKPVIWPDFRGLLIGDVQQILAPHHITLSCTHTKPQPPEHVCMNCIVVQHHPSAGSLVMPDADIALHVQLHLKAQN